jgi:hypothetical protein
VRKEDLYYLRVNQVEYAQDESRQAIQKQEDARLVLLLEKAIADLATARAPLVSSAPPRPAVAPWTTLRSRQRADVLIGASQPLEPQDFYNAVTQIEINQLEAKRVIAHPADIRDLYTWDINVTGFKFKDEVFAGGKITKFGEFQIQKSIIVPQGEVFLTAEPEFVGVMPIMYSLDVEENHQVEQFYKGWVMDEMIGMLILNPAASPASSRPALVGAGTKLDITGCEVAPAHRALELAEGVTSPAARADGDLRRTATGVAPVVGGQLVNDALAHYRPISSMRPISLASRWRPWRHSHNSTLASAVCGPRPSAGLQVPSGFCRALFMVNIRRRGTSHRFRRWPEPG